jgi:asparagine synthase (glutamine-hydrolysing)
VIAAVWDPAGTEGAHSFIKAIAENVGSPPAHVAVVDGVVLAAWKGTHPEGDLDARRGCVWVGTLGKIPDRFLSASEAVQLGGDYALVVRTLDGLLVARGSVAGRSLYYAITRSAAVVVCSRLAPLCGCVGRARIDDDWLASAIVAQSAADLSCTVSKEVKRVGASQAILLTQDGPKTLFETTLRPHPHAGRLPELIEELKSRLRLGVERAIDGRNRIAVMASGGLDSSCVLANAVALARGADRREIEAVTLTFAAPGDDRPHLAAICESLGIVPIRVRPSETRQHLLGTLVSDGAPMTWPTSAWETTLLQVARDRGADVVLTGNGGDHMFNGNIASLAREAAGGRPWDAVRSAVRLRTHFPSTAWSRIVHGVVAPLLVEVAPKLRQARRRIATRRRYPWMGAKLKRVVLASLDRHVGLTGHSEQTCASKINSFIRSEFLEIAEFRGQLEAKAGCTRADPLLDADLVELIASLPPHYLLHGDSTRGLFREALRGLVPDSVRTRVDKGSFEPAIAEVVGVSESHALRDLATMRCLSARGLVEPHSYRHHFESVLADGPKSQDWLAIWPALAAEAFLRQHEESNRSHASFAA